MPEVTYEQLTELFTKNEEVSERVHSFVNQYFRDYHYPGWNIIDGAKRWLEDYFFLLQAPIRAASLGGFILHKNDKKICYINTWHPRIYQYFVLFHEVYHILSSSSHDDNRRQPLHLIESTIDDDLEERAADYFASIVLMDAREVRSFYQTLHEEDCFEKKIFLTMNRFTSPYKAVLIRLFELNLIDDQQISSHFDKIFDWEATAKEYGIDPYNFQRSGHISFGRLLDKMKQSDMPDIVNESNYDVYIQVKNYFEKIAKDG
ncbi:ImmA/IrrE family metallo-endopeptidase [Brevibacillus dissolubilis]|uniref:ImmA/IrrE family metallo-endopeptidase n=1 Tax=Brevibacillus dissolubilis TaxID=1844116 RepID=UPI001115DC46|nr:ImmA/IrrE family metallo-endopeptidase [Brevibacillus dissolubilis]